MSRIDQGVFARICIKPPEQVILTAGIKMHSRFVEQKHAACKRAAAVVHEAQIEREEPLESPRLLFKRKHADVPVEFFDLSEKTLAIGAKLNLVGTLRPTVRNRAGQNLSGILEIVLPFANGARVLRVSLLDQFLCIQSGKLENHQQCFVLRCRLLDPLQYLIEMCSPFEAAVLIHVNESGQMPDDALMRFALHRRQCGKFVAELAKQIDIP